MLEKIFKLKEHNTNVKTEVIAGFATFMTMAYIIGLNPNIIASSMNGASGELWNAVFLATIISSAIGTLLMAFLANKPFALAPGMGLNAYFATVVLSIAAKAGLSYDDAFEGALAIIFFSGVLFTILTLLKVREKIVEAIPVGVRHGITAGIGLMLVYIGLSSNAGIYGADGSCFTMIGFFSAGARDTHTAMNDSGASYTLLMIYIVTFFIGLFTIVILNHKKVKGSILYGMLSASIVFFICEAIFMGVNPFESLKGASFLPAFGDLVDKTLFKFKFSTLFDLGYLTAIMTIISFCMVDMFDTIGTLLGTASKAGMLDKDGKMENMNKAMLSDSLATIAGSVTGTSTVTTFIESAAGVEEGGRTGLTSLVTGLSFLACMFLAPIAALIPAPATSAALVFVGVLMLGALKEVDYSDFSQSVPVMLMLVFMMITSGIGNGIGIGLISYSIIKLCTGKAKDVSILTIILSLLFIGKFFIIF
ncbi:MAG: NCS2 family permease [Clostridiales bacterium]|nr:NCS2 family permease [Clostridiales bacterium]